jgi:hypothetical protein
MLENCPGWLTRLYELYCGPDYGECCHYIGRTETLAADLEEVLMFLGYDSHVLKGTLDRIRRRRKHVSSIPAEETSSELEERLLRAERLVIKRFYGGDNHRFYGEMTLRIDRDSDLDFGPFQFACPPFCGGEWVTEVTKSLLGCEGEGNLHEPPRKKHRGFFITLVRDPYNWLGSYYQAVRSKKERKRTERLSGLPNHLTKTAEGRSFHGFCREVARLGGFTQYVFGVFPGCVYRHEDLVASAVELMMVLRPIMPTRHLSAEEFQHRVHKLHQFETSLRMQYVPPRSSDSEKVIDTLREAEAEFCETYEY